MENKNTLFGIYYDWWKNIDKFLFSLIVLLFSTGLFFSLVSTSLIASDKLDTNDYQFFFKHLVFILLGIIIIFVLSSIKKEQLLKYSSLFFAISISIHSNICGNGSCFLNGLFRLHILILSCVLYKSQPSSKKDSPRTSD